MNTEMSKNLQLLLIIGLMLIYLDYFESKHICHSPAVSKPTINLPRTRGKTSSPLRIILEYTKRFKKLKNNDDIKTALIDPAAEYWSDALRAVDASDDPFYVAKQCKAGGYSTISGEGYCKAGCNEGNTCGGASIPKKYLKCKKMEDGSPQITEDEEPNGEPGDILLLVDYNPRDQYCKDNTLVYAVPCTVSAEINRPEVGYINFCQEFADFDYPADTTALKAVTHQMAHALGFNVGLFAFMHDEQGRPRTSRTSAGLPSTPLIDQAYHEPSENVLTETELRWDSEVSTTRRTVHLLVTPTIQKHARKHYRCDSLEGVELEDIGVRDNHFKKRVVMEELMSGVVTVDSRVSPLTLGYFKDSGWYHVDMSQAEAWNWGRGLGCNFVERSCYAYISYQMQQSVSYRPWCIEEYSTGTECTQDNSAFGSCNLMQYSEALPGKFQYFTDPKLGGSDKYADYCPYIQTSENDCDTPTTICTDSVNYALTRLNRAGQWFGDDAICLNHHTAQPWNFFSLGLNRTYAKKMATCHQYECSAEQGLTIFIGDQEITCSLGPREVEFDAKVEHGRLVGTIVCPGCLNVCKDQCPTT